MKPWTQFPAVCPDVTTRQVGQDKVVLHLGSGDYYTLNEVAAFLWDRIDGRRTLDEMLALLLAEYAVDEPTARQDVLELVGRWQTEKLIELRDAPAAV